MDRVIRDYRSGSIQLSDLPHGIAAAVSYG